jgi:lysophospholipase L1-like esterase
LKYLLATFIILVLAVPVSSQDIWEPAMQAFEALDAENTYPPESIFFTGSSSIVLWKTVAQDMAPYPVIHRGFGGSNMTDVLRYADRYIKKHSFRAMVVFVANDIVGNPETDKTPEHVRDGFRDFILKIRSYNAEAPIFIIAITPTNSRWAVWSKTKKANSLIAQLCDEHKGVIFIPTEDLFLGEDGKPTSELFVSDQLHLSEAGYAVWSKRVRSYVETVLN